MAGYFSNHSQSRFLANSSTQQSQAANNNNTAPQGGKGTPPPPRVRAPSSKHFSTSVSTSSSGDEKPSGKDKLAANGGSNGVVAGSVHPLRHTWVFWFRQQRSPGNKITSYEEGIKKISTFGSIESFWSVWTHLNTPSALQPTTDYLLFHSNIRRPVWEDPLNIQGGKWILRLKKGIADRIWEDIVLAIIGDQFNDCDNLSEEEAKQEGAGEPQICGCTLSVRQHEDILSVWNKDADTKINNKIKETIRQVLNLPQITVMEYKSNNESMQDRSSFRISSDRSALS